MSFFCTIRTAAKKGECTGSNRGYSGWEATSCPLDHVVRIQQLVFALTCPCALYSLSFAVTSRAAATSARSAPAALAVEALLSTIIGVAKMSATSSVPAGAPAFFPGDPARTPLKILFLPAVPTMEPTPASDVADAMS